MGIVNPEWVEEDRYLRIFNNAFFSKPHSHWIKDYKAPGGGTQLQTFTYDEANRLTSAQASGGSQGTYGQDTYTYDPSTGNLTTKAGITLNYADAAHKHAVTSLSSGNGTFTYDANGNMITRSIPGIA